MLKKFLLTAVAFTVVHSAVAVPAPYVGGSVGVVSNSVRDKSKIFTTTVNSVTGSYRGVPVNLFAGYGGLVNDNFYLAGELSARVATADLSGQSTYRTSYGYGASVLPGVALSKDSLIFGRLGVVRDRFSKVKTTQTGAEFGAGIQTRLTQNVDLRGEYDYVAYRSFNKSTNSVFSNNFDPRADQFSLGVVYKFE